MRLMRLAMLIGPVATAMATAMAAAIPAAAQTLPRIPFDSVANLLKPPPHTYLGEVSGVAVDSRGRIFVLSRGNVRGTARAGVAGQLLEFGPDGSFVREIGQGLYSWSLPHAVKIDTDDNVWATDEGANQLVKFDRDGRIALLLGHRQQAADRASAPATRAGPLPAANGAFPAITDVARDSAGNVYVSDGGNDQRIVKISRDGALLWSRGGPGTEPGRFHTPHSLAVDAKDNIYVADRDNRRIQVFGPDGNLLRVMTIDVPYDANAVPGVGPKPKLPIPPGKPQTLAPGAPWAICITPGPNQVLYSADAYPGRIYKLTLDGKVLGVLGNAGKQPGQFGWVHEIACPAENTLFVAELLNWRIQKLTLRP